MVVPGGGLFLMSEVPLYESHLARISGHNVTNHSRKVDIRLPGKGNSTLDLNYIFRAAGQNDPFWLGTLGIAGLRSSYTGLRPQRGGASSPSLPRVGAARSGVVRSCAGAHFRKTTLIFSFDPGEPRVGALINREARIKRMAVVVAIMAARACNLSSPSWLSGLVTCAWLPYTRCSWRI